MEPRLLRDPRRVSHAHRTGRRRRAAIFRLTATQSTRRRRAPRRKSRRRAGVSGGAPRLESLQQLACFCRGFRSGAGGARPIAQSWKCHADADAAAALAALYVFKTESGTTPAGRCPGGHRSWDEGSAADRSAQRHGARGPELRRETDRTRCWTSPRCSTTRCEARSTDLGWRWCTTCSASRRNQRCELAEDRSHEPRPGHRSAGSAAANNLVSAIFWLTVAEALALIEDIRDENAGKSGRQPGAREHGARPAR